MVTGDNINTAKAIARDCGILTDDGIAIEWPDFRTREPQRDEGDHTQNVTHTPFLVVTHVRQHGAPEREALAHQRADQVGQPGDWCHPDEAHACRFQ